MTTTAHEDQFTVGTQTIEPVRQPYSTEAILRRNVAELEVALKQQTDRAEAAEAELLAVRENNRSMMLEIHNLRIVLEQAEAELKSARDALQSWIDSRNGWMERAEAALKEAQEHVLIGHQFYSNPTDVWIDCDADGVSIAKSKGAKVRNVYAHPIPAPAAPAPVPEEWRNMLQWLIDQRGKNGHSHKVPGIWDDDNGKFAGKHCEQCAMYDRARALLQSAEVKK